MEPVFFVERIGYRRPRPAPIADRGRSNFCSVLNCTANWPADYTILNAVTDAQFLKSMIPHHAGAILMCEKAPLQDKEVKALCQGIVTGQRAEIAQMRAKLQSLGK